MAENLEVKNVKTYTYSGEEGEGWAIVTSRGGYVEDLIYFTQEQAMNRLEEVKQMLANGYTLYSDNSLRKEPPFQPFDSDINSTIYGPAFSFGAE